MSHPAARLVEAGNAAGAIRLLLERRDHPSGLALLQAGMEPEALAVLEEVAPTPPIDEEAAP